MSITVGVVMDPIASVSFKKDSTLAMLLAAQRRGWRLAYMEMKDLFLRDGRAHARMRDLTVRHDEQRWFDLGERRSRGWLRLLGGLLRAGRGLG